MRRRLAFGVLLLAALGLAVTTSAGKPAAVKEVPVTVAFPVGYAIQSDAPDPYANGVKGVRAVLVASGNLALDTDYTSSPTVRKLFLSFTGGCTTGACDAPFSSVTVVAFVSTSSCDLPGGLRDMPIPGSQSCSLNVNFPANGLGWFLRFGETDDTTPATVARLADGSWTIDVPTGGTAKLLSYPTKGRMVLTDRGNYVMPVHMTVTQP